MPKKTALDIFVLAMLSNGPLHGYELISKMREGNFDRWIEIGDSSVYQSLTRLESKGFVKTTEIRIGKTPPRTVFELNKKGETYLQEGLTELLRKSPVFPDEFNIPLFASGALKKAELISALEEQKRMASAKLKEIEDVLAELKDKKSEVGVQLIYDRLLALHKAHLRWLTDAIFLIKRR
ncbi:MAG: PadR family transcriptional regulator [bacterium]